LSKLQIKSGKIKHLIEFFSNLKEYQDFILYTLRPGEVMEIIYNEEKNESELVCWFYKLGLPEKDV
jgi:hypothetical protein